MAKVNLIVKETLDITCMRHDTFKLDMDWEDADDNAIDLTSYSFKAQVRKKSTSATTLLSFENEDFDKDANGNLLMKKNASDMTIKGGVYTYDLQATHTSTAEVATWLGGLFIVKDDVTE